MVERIHFEPISEDALLLRFGDTIDPAASARVLAAAATLQRALPTLECVPAYASVLLRFDPAAWRDDPSESQADPPPATHARLQQAVIRALDSNESAVSTPRDVVIPVCYGGDAGPDLATVAAHARIGEAEVVARHVAGRYRVAMIGFAPGFPYLLGLDPLLAMPRRADPRQRVPGGSVAIGGAQTGIYPRDLPGGWHLIGRTPETLFDPHQAQPSLLAPGDRVRFDVIDAARLTALRGRVVS